MTLPHIELFTRPFSNFAFVEEHFAASFTIRKVFSQARSRGAVTLVAEAVPPSRMVQEENEDIQAAFPTYTPGHLIQVSFWRVPFTSPGCLGELRSEDCLGYALLKEDDFLIEKNEDSPWRDGPLWHVFEAVMAAYPHHHSFFKAGRSRTFAVLGSTFTITGCLFAQQNMLNKACAQVALRSLAEAWLGRDVSYREINRLAAAYGLPDFSPSRGLYNDEVTAVLDGLGIAYKCLDYTKRETEPGMENIRREAPWQKFAYAGVESGCGSLVCFRTQGPEAKPNDAHMVAVFGHTFNEDSWAPYGEGAYFKIGEAIQHLPSRAWTSNFIIHDENFGPNLCLPHSWLDPADVHFVVELLRAGWQHSGVPAEVIASGFFYSILPEFSSQSKDPRVHEWLGRLDPGARRWLQRLEAYVKAQQLILRPVPVKREEYLAHLESATDWSFAREKEGTLEELRREGALPECLWMVELSVPEVFSTNKRKLGEILLNAGGEVLSPEFDGRSFVAARVPGCYVFFDRLKPDGTPEFRRVPSGFSSHLPLFGT